MCKFATEYSTTAAVSSVPGNKQLSAWDCDLVGPSIIFNFQTGPTHRLWSEELPAPLSDGGSAPLYYGRNELVFLALPETS